MPQLCFYFQLHQPYRLRDFSLFEIGNKHDYFGDDDSDHNQLIFQKVAHKSYLPMLKILWELLQQQPDFCFTLSCSGVFLEQALAYEPEVIKWLKKCLKTGRVEMLSETFFHSLASLYSPAEFKYQVKAHQRLIKKLFGVTPTVFRNTELIYSNDIGEAVADLGYKGMLTEAVPRYLHGRTKTQLFVDKTGRLPLLLKHAELSDDIAFRFSDRNWQWYPLTVERYQEWLGHYGRDEVINLFMDFETFGEHQWVDTGIFEFFKRLVGQVCEMPDLSFVTPSFVIDDLLKKTDFSPSQLPDYDVPNPISWADVDRDISAWVENAFQQDTIRVVYELAAEVLKTRQPDLIADWRKLLTSDHFYYMCTKWSADGDVHAYFSPYDSPYEAYRRYSLVLADLRERVLHHQ
jgi:alpha-amylase